MVLTGRHTVIIVDGITSEEVQADDVMGIISFFPCWKAVGRCIHHEVCVVDIVTSLLRFVLVGIKVETLKTLPSKYC